MTRLVFPLLISLSVVLVPVESQSFFDYPLPENIEESKNYQKLLDEKEQQWLLIQREIARAARSNLPVEAESQLRQLATKVLTGQREAFLQQFDAFCEAQDTAIIDTGLILRAQRRVAALDAQLLPYNHIKSFSGPGMAYYSIDTSLSHIREELAFYAVESGQRVAEIGAGDERFATALMVSVDSLTLFVNDIDSAALLEIAYHIQHNPLLKNPGSNIYPILGAPRNAGLGEARFDKIIVRNAFHHFTYAQEMLRSIRKALLPEGRLYLKERYLEECAEDCCEFAMEESDVKTALRSSGFHLLEEESIIDENGHRWHLMQWRPEHVAP